MKFNLDEIKKHVFIDSNNCWIWQKAKTKDGYGQICEGKQRFYVHRYVAEIVYGKCPDGKEVMHFCDVRSCCNPEHLRYGTRKENCLDASNKGRLKNRNHLFGEKHPITPLSEGDVREIRELRKKGLTFSKLSDIYHVSITAIHNIVKRKTWRSVL